jgi:hypothetical protein
MNDLKPHKRLGPRSRVRSWLVRPATLKVAFAILRVVDLVARAYDWIRR